MIFEQIMLRNTAIWITVELKIVIISAICLKAKRPLLLFDKQLLPSLQNPNTKIECRVSRSVAEWPLWLRHGCQMAIARFLHLMYLALRASGLWLRYNVLQNLKGSNFANWQHWPAASFVQCDGSRDRNERSFNGAAIPESARRAVRLVGCFLLLVTGIFGCHLQGHSSLSIEVSSLPSITSVCAG